MIEMLSRNWAWAIAHPIRSYRHARACLAAFPSHTPTPERKS